MKNKVTFLKKNKKFILTLLVIFVVSTGILIGLKYLGGKKVIEAPKLEATISSPSTQKDKFYLKREDLLKLVSNVNLAENKNYFTYYTYEDGNKNKYVLFRSESGIQRFTFYYDRLDVLVEETTDQKNWKSYGVSKPIYQLFRNSWEDLPSVKEVKYSISEEDNLLTLTQTIETSLGENKPKAEIIWEFGIVDDRVRLKNTFKLSDYQLSTKARMIWQVELVGVEGELPKIVQSDKRVELGNMIVDWSDFREDTLATYEDDGKFLNVMFFESGVTEPLVIDPTFSLSTGTGYFGFSDGTRKWCFARGGASTPSATTGQFWQPGRLFHTLGGTVSLPSDCTDGGAANENVFPAGGANYDYLIGEDSSIADSTSVVMSLLESTSTRSVIQTFRDNTVDNYSRVTVYPTGQAFTTFRMGTLTGGGDAGEIAMHCPSGTIAQTYSRDTTNRAHLFADTSNNNFPGTLVIPFTRYSIPDVDTSDTSCTFTDWAGWYEGSISTSYYAGFPEFTFMTDVATYRATTTTRDTRLADYTVPDVISDGLQNATIWDKWGEQSRDMWTSFEGADSDLCGGGDGFTTGSCNADDTAVGNYTLDKVSGTYSARFDGGATGTDVSYARYSSFGAGEFVGVRMFVKILTETLGNNQDLDIVQVWTTTANTESLVIRQNGSGNLVFCVLDTATTAFCTTTTLSTNTWYQVDFALSYPGNESAYLGLWLNGVLENSSSAPSLTGNTDNIRIGLVASDVGNNDILIDDVVISHNANGISNFHQAEGAYTINAVDWTKDILVDIDTGSAIRSNPTLLIRNWRQMSDPGVFKLEGKVLDNATEYNADVLPFSEAWVNDSDAACGTSGWARLGDGGDTSDADEFLFSTSATGPDQNFNFGGETVNAQTCIWGDSTTDRFLLGRTDRFAGVNVLLSTIGVGTPSVTWEYCSANTDTATACDTWSTLTVTNQDSGASTLTANGNFYFTPPSQWIRSTENSGKAGLFFIRGTVASGSYSTYPVELKITPDILAIQYIGDIDKNDTTFTISSKPDTGIANWNFDSPGSSSTLDNSGKGNTLTVSGATWKQQGNSNTPSNRHSYYSFDGSNDFMSRNDEEDLRFQNGPFSVTGWFRHVSAVSGTDTILAKASGVNGYGYKVYMESDGNVCFGIDDTAGSFPADSACSTNAYNDSKWHHFAAVKYMGTLEIWIDGKREQSTTITGFGALDSTGTLYLGIDADGTNNPWTGDLDSVVIYPYALTESQIKADIPNDPVGSLFGASPDDPLTSGLVAWWKMDEGTAGSRADSSGNGNTQTQSTGDTIAVGQGKFGFSSDFESGDTEYLENNSFSGLPSNSDITMASWINIESAPSCSSCGASLMDSAFILELNEGGSDDDISSLAILYWDGASFQRTGLSAELLSASTWYHVAVTYSPTNTTYKIYLNGEIISTGSLNHTYDAVTAVWLGYIYNDYYDGLMDDTRIYNRVLSDNEIRNLYSYAPPPVVHYKFEDNTGTTASDSSGNSISGTLTGNATWSPSKIGSGIEMDGSGDYISYNDTADNVSRINGSWTIGGWVKFDTLNTTFTSLVYKGVTDADANYTIQTRSTPNQDEIRCQYRNQSSVFQTLDSNAADLVTGTWYHIECAFDDQADTLTLYINGKYNNSGAATGSPLYSGTSDLVVGYSNATFGSSSLDGMMDDVRIYNYVRTPKQVVEDMNGGHPTGGSPIGSQAAYWKMDEQNGQNLTTPSPTTFTAVRGTTSSSEGSDPTWRLLNSCKVNGCLEFDGSDDVATITNTGAIDLNENLISGFTFTAWVYPDGAGEGTGGQIFYKGTNTWLRVDTLSSGLLDLEASVDLATSDATLNVSSVVTQSAWNHVAMTWSDDSDDEISLWVNGRKVGTSTNGSGAPAADTTNLSIGGTTTNNFDGRVDEFQIFNSELSQAELQIVQNANSTTAIGGVLNNTSEEGFAIGTPSAWWRFDDNSGSSATDFSGNNVTGTLSGNATWGYGKFGSALSLDGTSDYVSAGDNVNLVNGEALTISAWVYPTSSSQDASIVEKKASTAADVNGAGYSLYSWSTANFGNTCLYVSDGSGNGSDQYETCTADFTTDTLNTWYHIVGVYDDTGTSGSTIYLNGANAEYASYETCNGCPTGISDIGSTTNTEGLCIGTDSSTSGACATSNEFTGRIDDVRIYKSALTARQVAYLFNRGAPIVHYKLDECSGSTAYNSAVNVNGLAAGINGTITPGSSGNTSTGNCNSGTSTEMWNDGTTGKYNSGLGFDGTDDYIIATSTTAITDLTNKSISAWVYLNGYGEGSYGRIVDKGQNVTNYRGWGVFANNGGTCNNGSLAFLQSRGSDSTNGWWCSPTSSLSTGQWVHVVVTYDSSSTSNDPVIYINGISQTITEAQTPSGTLDSESGRDLYIGNRYNNDRTFDGIIDDFRLYNYILDANQVKLIYNSGAIRFGPSTGSP